MTKHKKWTKSNINIHDYNHTWSIIGCEWYFLLNMLLLRSHPDLRGALPSDIACTNRHRRVWVKSQIWNKLSRLYLVHKLHKVLPIIFFSSSVSTWWRYQWFPCQPRCRLLHKGKTGEKYIFLSVLILVLHNVQV